MEAVGVAASIAGLVGLSGQLLNGAIFLKGFISDFSNAQERVLDLQEEITILVDSAEHTNDLVAICRQDGILLEENTYVPAFKRCIKLVEGINSKLEADMQRLKGRLKWLAQMRSAAGAKAMETYMQRIERAKTQIMDVESRIMISMQQISLRASAQITTSVEAVHGWTSSADQKFRNLETGIEKGLLRTDLEIRNMASVQWSQQQSLMNIEQSMKNIVCQGQEIVERFRHATNDRHTLPAIEDSLRSVLDKESRKHNQQLLMQGSQERNSLTPSHLPWRSDETWLCPESANSTPMRTTESVWSGRNSMEDEKGSVQLRRDKLIYKSRYRTPFFQVDVKTTKVQRRQKIPDSQGNESLYAEIPEQHITRYEILLNLPFWKAFKVFQSGDASMVYGSHLRKSLTTHTLVPWDSPIIQACINLDLGEVQRLFGTGAASPNDLDDKNRWSLAEICIFNARGKRGRELSLERDSDLMRLLSFLFQLPGHEVRLSEGGSQGIMSYFSATAKNLLLGEHIIRLLASSASTQDPFDNVRACRIVNDPFHPLFPLLSTQETWWIETDIKAYRKDLEHCFLETVADMQSDPCGLSLGTALSKGLPYAPFAFPFYFEIKGVENHGPLYHLLYFISLARSTEERSIYVNRLRIVLRSRIDVRQQHLLQSSRTSVYQGSDYFMFPRAPISPTAFAACLHLQDVWAMVLSEAGWSEFEIQELSDEDTYRSISDLVDGRLCFSTMVEQQVDFIEKLRRGWFADWATHDIQRFSKSMEYELNSDSKDIEDVILMASNCFKQRSTPGSWVTEEEIYLEPDVDFKLPVGWFHCNNDATNNWKCIREYGDAQSSGAIKGHELSHYCLSFSDKRHGNEEAKVVEETCDDNDALYEVTMTHSVPYNTYSPEEVTSLLDLDGALGGCYRFL